MADLIVCPRRTRTQDLTGKTFGRLTVLRFAGYYRGQFPYWHSICTCGHTATSAASALKQGNTQSCGCLREERKLQSKITHGMSYTSLYAAWHSMKSRCLNPKAQQWRNYGGRGITVCEEWLIFPSFMKDMGPSWRPGLSLNRKDNNAGYFKENCTWSTIEEQSNNTRRSHFVEYQGETRTIMEWSRHFGIGWSTIKERIRRGWPSEKLFTPVRKPTDQRTFSCDISQANG